MLPHSAIYIKYIAAPHKFRKLFRLFDMITGCLFKSANLSFTLSMTSKIKKIKLINSCIGKQINHTRCLRIVSNRRKGRTLVNARNVDTASNIERKRAGNTNIRTKRLRGTIIRTSINSLNFTVHIKYI